MPALENDETEDMLTHDAIVKALRENYESIYAVDLETSAYRSFHEKNSYDALCIQNSGTDFFGAVLGNIEKTVYPDDQVYVRKMMVRDHILSELETKKYYPFVYRLMKEGKPLYHKLRAMKEKIQDRPYLLIGIRNIDPTYRMILEQSAELASLHSKDMNHLDAILASSEGYVEANLTRDRILEISPKEYPDDLPAVSGREECLTYSLFEEWMLENMVVENQEKYKEISDREYLIRCFENGERRASVSYSCKAGNGETKPCKQVFFLYRDEVSEDILSFCVVYDLTEQQRKEKEVQELEQELQMIRIRNFTSQMQPHFLYNALASIQEIILEDPAYAYTLIGDFTVHLRSCIRAMANDAPIPFEHELANIQAYANIEKMRFGDKLRVVYDIQTKDFEILPLSVQPLVENAIRHGIYERGTAGGTVILHTREEEDSWIIIVEDDGVGFDVSSVLDEKTYEKSGSAGLRNIMFRLDKIMGASVSVKSSAGTGTMVTVIVPKEDKEI